MLLAARVRPEARQLQFHNDAVVGFGSVLAAALTQKHDRRARSDLSALQEAMSVKSLRAEAEAFAHAAHPLMSSIWEVSPLKARATDS